MPTWKVKLNVIPFSMPLSLPFKVAIISPQQAGGGRHQFPGKKMYSLLQQFVLCLHPASLLKSPFWGLVEFLLGGCRERHRAHTEWKITMCLGKQQSQEAKDNPARGEMQGTGEPASTHTQNPRSIRGAAVIKPEYPRRSFRESQPTSRSPLCVTTGDMAQRDPGREAALCELSETEPEPTDTPSCLSAPGLLSCSGNRTIYRGRNVLGRTAPLRAV